MRKINCAPDRIILEGKIKDQTVDIFIDTGATRSFISSELAAKGIIADFKQPFEVEIASCERIKVTKEVGVNFVIGAVRIQSTKFEPLFFQW